MTKYQSYITILHTKWHRDRATRENSNCKWFNSTTLQTYTKLERNATWIRKQSWDGLTRSPSSYWAEPRHHVGIRWIRRQINTHQGTSELRSWTDGINITWNEQSGKDAKKITKIRKYKNEWENKVNRIWKKSLKNTWNKWNKISRKYWDRKENKYRISNDKHFKMGKFVNQRKQKRNTNEITHKKNPVMRFEPQTSVLRERQHNLNHYTITLLLS